jgi:PIN domain nuclease of toxin-antitoxin system
MRVLLDTCSFLWIAIDSPELSERAREVFRDPENEVFLSSVSTWEIAVKHALGRLPLPEAPDVYVPRLRQRHGIAPLPLGEEATLYLGRLPALHRDPFDRMLVCQSVVEGMVLLTPDESITRYPIRSTW